MFINNICIFLICLIILLIDELNGEILYDYNFFILINIFMIIVFFVNTIV